MGIFDKFKTGFKKSASAFTSGLRDIVVKKEIDDNTLDRIEEYLIQSDVGVVAASEIKEIISDRKIDPKEDIADEDTLATLDKHFYIKLHAYMKKLETVDFDKAESMLNQLVRIRQGKIVRLADSSKLTSDLSSKLSVEEEVYYNQIHNASLAFKEQILGKKK